MTLGQIKWKTMEAITFACDVWENWYNPDEVYGVCYEEKPTPSLGERSRRVACAGDAGVIDAAGIVRWGQDAKCVGNHGYRYHCLDMASTMYEVRHNANG